MWHNDIMNMKAFWQILTQSTASVFSWLESQGQVTSQVAAVAPSAFDLTIGLTIIEKRYTAVAASFTAELEQWVGNLKDYNLDCFQGLLVVTNSP